MKLPARTGRPPRAGETGRSVAGVLACLIAVALAAVPMASDAATRAVRVLAARAGSVITDNRGVVLSHRRRADTGALGVTFGFETETLAGGPYVNPWPIYNVPMYEASTGSDERFWLNYVEELVNGGVNFVAVDTRGYIPGSAIPNEGGDPRELTQLVDAIRQAGDAGKLKIAAFDDTPASMTDKKNQIKHHTGGYVPPSDFADLTGAGEDGLQYRWNNDLEAFFQSVPASMLYKINGRPLIYLWSDNDFAFTNQSNGNSARYLSYVRSQAERGFGENPYFVVDDSWINNDRDVPPVVQGEDDWFIVPSPTYTNQAFDGHTFGVTVPSFEEVDASSSLLIPPDHGSTLVNGLEHTVGNDDYLTLVEGFSDWLENAALWRTEPGPYSATHRDYPSQDINILRRYSQTPFPSPLTVQAATADAVAGASPNPFNVYRSDLGVQVTSDAGGGWNVGDIRAGETETWYELPMQGTVNLTIRVASRVSGGRLRLVIDGVAGPVVTVPRTGGWQKWETIGVGAFRFRAGTYHTVELRYLTGGFNVNWWQATRS